MRKDLELIEKQTLEGLKDFQRATVERVFDLMVGPQKRVLIADEVGLGKTLVAKGVIAKMARYHAEELNDNLFKVVYICSNQNIATQNINKLKITDSITVDGVSDTRLSMQHLKIFEQENDDKVLNNYIQIIPLTPGTSFSMTYGGGSQDERALIYAVMRHLEKLYNYTNELEILLRGEAVKGWNNWSREWYEKRVQACEKKTEGAYLEKMKGVIDEYMNQHGLYEEIYAACNRLRENGHVMESEMWATIGRLRLMFAEVSVDMMEPDLVIMDEFQRFKNLIELNLDTEAGMLVHRFMNSKQVDKDMNIQPMKVLLLSATPFKMYSTLEEIREIGIDEPYGEFFQVMNFLINDKEQQNSFKQIWENYSIKLQEADFQDISILSVKEKAEDGLFQAVCRTERIAAMGVEELLNDNLEKLPVTIGERDITSYRDMKNAIELADINGHVPVDYIKSSPFLMSYMHHYQLKEKIEDGIKQQPGKVKRLKKDTLWVKRKSIRKYRDLPPSNARLECLKKVAFESNGERLLWVPPSLPYYPVMGAYEDTDSFSKILIFSAWEMVPRMISTMISYEAERKTIGILDRDDDSNKQVGYFAKDGDRYPSGRLNFVLEKDQCKGMNLFTLLYPCKTLADYYNPIEDLNKKMDLGMIEFKLKQKIAERIESSDFNELESQREDQRWYCLAPLILDDPDYVGNWFEAIANADYIKKGLRQHLDELKSMFENLNKLELGRKPSDLVDVMVDMALASPAICGLRSFGGNAKSATELAKTMIDMFNKIEATAIVELQYANESSNPHWRNVLLYSKHGCFQAVLDEYVHMVMDSNGFKDKSNGLNQAEKFVVDGIKTRAASYDVDTYEAFRKRGGETNKIDVMKMRTHYAVAFYKGQSSQDRGGVKRRESVRNSFNSPFRPFVLATTSIGQEGLDFHYYARKIMHWNLPANAIDLEQREGRINRYKCHSIRKNIADSFKNDTFIEPIWDNLFEKAKEKYEGNHSELVPFWCLPDNLKYRIERIVPAYPFSKDVSQYERLIKIMSLYRLTMGQARQEDIIQMIIQSELSKEEIHKMFINLSPYFRES